MPMTIKTNEKMNRATTRQEYRPIDPLLCAREAAAERRQAISTFWRDLKNGVVPSPYYVGPKSPRWRLSEIRASIEATKKASSDQSLKSHI